MLPIPMCSDKTPDATADSPARAVSRDARLILILAALAVGMAVGLALAKLAPLRCDGCGSLVLRPHAKRLVPEWRMYCPQSALPQPRPLLCPKCLARLLDTVAVQDQESRRAVERLLTNPAAGQAFRRALQGSLMKSGGAQAPFPPQASP